MNSLCQSRYNVYALYIEKTGSNGECDGEDYVGLGMSDSVVVLFSDSSEVTFTADALGIVRIPSIKHSVVSIAYNTEIAKCDLMSCISDPEYPDECDGHVVDGGGLKDKRKVVYPPFGKLLYFEVEHEVVY